MDFCRAAGILSGSLLYRYVLRQISACGRRAAAGTWFPHCKIRNDLVEKCRQRGLGYSAAAHVRGISGRCGAGPVRGNVSGNLSEPARIAGSARCFSRGVCRCIHCDFMQIAVRHDTAACLWRRNRSRRIYESDSGSVLQ